MQRRHANFRQDYARQDHHNQAGRLSHHEERENPNPVQGEDSERSATIDLCW